MPDADPPGAPEQKGAEGTAEASKETESPDMIRQHAYSQLSRADRLKVAFAGPTLIFDGVCNLCNYSMQWLCTRLPTGSPVRLMWAQHPDTLELLALLGLSRQDVLRSWACVHKR